MLTSAGHHYRGHRTMADEAPATVYLHPTSETGKPGTLVFRARKGKQVVLSFGTNDPLYAERNGKPTYSDAYDAARRLA